MSSASHWKSAVDPRTGRTYFYHEITRETQWRKPMELASEAERMAMEEKERKQKDFFKSMEANILNSISQGVVPGTPKDPSALFRKKSSRPPVTGGDDRPELVRTISTMDDTLLRDLIRRQPSFRNVKKKKKPDSSASVSAGSFQGNDSEPSKRSTFSQQSDFESFVSIKSDRQQLESLAEGTGDDSLPELFSYLPDEDPGADGYSSDGSLDMTEGNSSIKSLKTKDSVRSDGGKFNESSLTGFGLTWEETQALKKLADITKEMIEAEHDPDLDLGEEKSDADAHADADASRPSQTPSWKAKDSKGMRDLPREIDFEDDSDGESPAPKNKEKDAAGPTLQKATDIGGQRALPRELDFEDSDSENESDFVPTPAQEQNSKNSDEKKSSKPGPLPKGRPEVKRRNTCGTLYVGTTMSAPDKDATIKCVCGVYRTHILSSELDDTYNPDTDSYNVFNDLECDQGESVSIHSSSTSRGPVPSLNEVTRFYRDIFYKAQMESDCIIMSLIYVERLIKRTNGGLRPRSSNWHSLLFSCMILSSKVWDDLSMWNADFSQSCPPGVSFPLQRINQLELSVLNALSFKVKVPASEYAKYYFLLRSMIIKSGLGGDEITLDPLDVVGARRLQQVSSQFESLTGAKAKALANRSQSLNVHDRARMQAKTGAPTKVGLEHVVHM